MKVSVEHHFLTERGSHRLQASLSSDERSNFPPELPKRTIGIMRFSNSGRERPLSVNEESALIFFYNIGQEPGWYRGNFFVPCCMIYNMGLFNLRAQRARL